MKIFLGVLENDVLGQDIGLSDVDPRRLAQGAWEEVVFVGESLCWLGRNMGLLQPDSSFTSERPPEKTSQSSDHSHASGSCGPTRTISPSTRSTLTNSMNSDLSMDGADDDTQTTVPSTAISMADPGETQRPRSTSECRAHSRRSPENRQTPLCIHEVDDPSFLVHEDERSMDDQCGSHRFRVDDAIDGLCAPDDTASSLCGYSSSPVGHAAQIVRYDGWIEEVDNDLEVQVFEESRAYNKRASVLPSRGSRARHVGNSASSIVRLAPLCYFLYEIASFRG